MSDNSILGMLYIVEVRLVRADTGEKLKHKLLMVGCEQADIGRKLKWVFDSSEYKEFAITGTEKVREKIHFLSTVITQMDEPVSPSISRDEGSQVVPQQKLLTQRYEPKLFAMGVTTTMVAKDQGHAIRKLGYALISSVTEGKSHTGALLSQDSTVTIEEIPLKDGFAKARDVSNEVNKATFVRG